MTALLAACSRAAAEADCVPAAEAPQGSARALAIISWQGGSRVLIEVGIRREGRPEWRSRTLVFEPRDEPLERWRTIGFIVGTLSRGDPKQPTPDAPVAPPAPPEPAPPAETRPKASTEATSPAAMPAPPAPSRGAPAESAAPVGAQRSSGSAVKAAVDLGAAVGPALEGLRLGVLARSRWPVTDALRAVFAVRYLERPSGSLSVRGRWFTVSAGLATAFGTDQLELALGLDGRAEYFQAFAAIEGREDSSDRWLTGAGLDVVGAWMPTSRLGVFVGGDAAWMFGTTELRLAGDTVATDPAARFNVEAGVRLKLW